MITRYLIVSCLYQSSKSENCMPLICLAGNWLEYSGFVIGDEVSVEVTRKGEIVIRADVCGCMEKREVKKCEAGVESLTYLH